MTPTLAKIAMAADKAHAALVYVQRVNHLYACGKKAKAASDEAYKAYHRAEAWYIFARDSGV